jgi:molybdate transport repressor ModE-like protein
MHRFIIGITDNIISYEKLSIISDRMSYTDDLTVRYDVVVEYRGLKVIDRKTASILKMIKERRSILGAAKALGLPYSKVYETMAKIEKLLGKKVVEVKRGGRGGGGASLTDFGEKLLLLYELALSKIFENGLGPLLDHLSEDPTLLIANSYDPALPAILDILIKSGDNIQSICVTSKKALAMLMLGLVDIACVTLYDPETRSYNRRYLEKLWLFNDIEFLGGYSREIVFAVSRDLNNLDNLDGLVLKILNGELVLAGIDRTAGLRILLESLLIEYAQKYGFDLGRLRGLEKELPSPEAVARSVAKGEADVGLTLKYYAVKYRLKSIHLVWDSYECYVLKTRVNNITNRLKNLLNSDDLKQILNSFPGYRPLT